MNTSTIQCWLKVSSNDARVIFSLVRVVPKLWHIQYEFLYPSSLEHFEYRRSMIREAVLIVQDQLISSHPAFYFFLFLSLEKRPFPKPDLINLRFHKILSIFFVFFHFIIETKMHSIKSQNPTGKFY